jgi:hypothetical protein
MRIAIALDLLLALFIALLIALLIACGGKGEDKDKGGAPDKAGSAHSPPPAARGLDKVAVAFSGKPVAMQRAFVKRMEPDRYQLYLTSQGGSCAELLDNMFSASDRIDVLATVTPRLDVDGKPHLQVTDVYEGAPTMEIAPGARAAITGAAATGEAVTVALDFVARAKEPEAGGLSIEVHGTFTAEGCGARERDPDGMPRARHPTEATLTIANQRLELKGAIVKRGGDLLLSTGPKDCSGTTPWATVILERTGGGWRASGTWIERAATAADKPASAATLSAALGAAGKSEDGPTVRLALSGAGDLGGYRISLDGTIEAIDCR